MGENGRTRRRGGILYVTVTEFADRMGVNRSSVDRAIAKGQLQTRTFKGSSYKYLDFAKSQMAWEKRPKPHKPTRKDMLARSQGGYMDLSGFKPVTIDSEKDIENVGEIRDIGQISDGDNTFTLYNLDPNEFSDCWVFQNGEPLMNPQTHDYVYDWDKVDRKIKALLHNIQYQEKQGNLIAKSDVDFCLSMIFQPMLTAIDQIPDMHLSQIISVVEDRTGHKLDETTRTAIRNMMTMTTKRIAEEFQEIVRKNIG